MSGNTPLSKGAWLIALRKEIRLYISVIPVEFDAIEKVAFKAALDQLDEMCHISQAAKLRKRPLDVEYYPSYDDSRDKNDANWPK